MNIHSEYVRRLHIEGIEDDKHGTLAFGNMCYEILGHNPYVSGQARLVDTCSDVYLKMMNEKKDKHIVINRLIQECNDFNESKHLKVGFKDILYRVERALPN